MDVTKDEVNRAFVGVFSRTKCEHRDTHYVEAWTAYECRTCRLTLSRYAVENIVARLRVADAKFEAARAARAIEDARNAEPPAPTASELAAQLLEFAASRIRRGQVMTGVEHFEADRLAFRALMSVIEKRGA